MSDNDIIRKKKQFGEEEIEVIYRKLRPRPKMGENAAQALADGRQPIFMCDGFGDYPELNPRTYEVSPGIICEQDVCIPMRDGTRTYCDIFRPTGSEKVPLIIVYSFYGKRPCADTEGVVYQTLGVPEGTCSPNCKFEGPDPEYWCHQGYAVANYDQRGAVNSEGDIFMCTVEEGIDAYDVCEFLAVQDWCNGKVAFGGNSGLAVIQWKVASERPPHLACIAPWEGNLDTYRHLLSTGGITECGFNPYLFTKLYGTGYMEDHYQMVLEHPYYDAYWEEKVADIEKIEVPAYITGSWSHFHLYGGIDGYAKISSTEKWLRIHREFEWPDQYHRDNLEDLKKFFDRYMKGIRNGWESTPRVRIGVMDAYDKDKETHRVVENFPLPNTQYKKLYLSADGHLKTDLPEEEGQVSYDANIAKPTVTMQDDLTFDLKRVSPPKGDDRATFDLVVTEETELIGFAKLHLWVEAGGSDDLDLFVAIKKLDAEGNWIPTLVMGKPYPGTPGRQRVSLRELDEAKSTEARPYHTLNNPQKLKPGEIVPVDIEIWPSARAWHTGEQIRVEVMGYYERFDWWEPFDYATVNKGRHIIHTGGKYDSYFLIPTQPE